jgi:sarcosine oxidase subunit gamma
MSEHPAHRQRRSPLEHMAAELAAASTPGADGVTVSELRFPTLVNLRGDPTDARFREGAASVLGLDLPLEPNRFSRRDRLACLWLGPDEWLVVAEPDADPGLAPRLERALAGRRVSVVEVGAGYATLQLAGARAREVLAKACSLDLHPRAFRAGQCAQSNFARTQAVIALVDDAPIFRLYVRRSLAEYLAQWLLDAMREYRVISET